MTQVICVTWLEAYVGHESSHMCDVTRGICGTWLKSYVWRDSKHMWDMTQIICVTWLEAYVGHDSSDTCDLIHTTLQSWVNQCLSQTFVRLFLRKKSEKLSPHFKISGLSFVSWAHMSLFNLVRLLEWLQYYLKRDGKLRPNFLPEDYRNIFFTTGIYFFLKKNTWLIREENSYYLTLLDSNITCNAKENFADIFFLKKNTWLTPEENFGRNFRKSSGRNAKENSRRGGGGVWVCG